MMKDGRIVALDSTASLLSEFSQRVLRVKLEGCELPPALAAGATRDAAGWWRIPIADVAHVEEALRALRAAGATRARLEMAEPQLQGGVLKIIHRRDAVL